MNRFSLRYNRVHAVGKILRKRARTAHAASIAADLVGQQPMLAASLRGKVNAYREAAELIDRLEKNRRLRGRRWEGTAAAWDEGYQRGVRDAEEDVQDHADNPYTVEISGSVDADALKSAITQLRSSGRGASS